MNNINITKQELDKLVKNEGVEVYSKDQFDAFVMSNKDLIIKATNSELDDLEKSQYKEVTEEIGSFKRIEVYNQAENSTRIEKSIVFIRPKQVEWSEEIVKSEYNNLEKGAAMPIGTIHNGFKKISEGVWKKVSSMGLTKQEHESRMKEPITMQEGKSHQKVSKEVDDKDHSDEDVDNVGKENAKKLEYLQDDLKRGIQQLSEYDKINYKYGRVPLHIAKLEDKIAKLKKSESSDLFKGKTGIYTDTLLNRNLDRVGNVYGESKQQENTEE